MTDHLDELERMLQGGSSDEPSATASLLRRAATLPAATPAPELLAAMAHEARSAVEPIPHPSRRRSMLATKVATAAAAITLTVGGAAAAGALPDAAQDGIAEAGTHIGLNLPDTAADQAREATSADVDADADAETETETEEVETDDVETDETHELGNVTNGTDADAHGEDVSAVATDDSLTGAEKGAAVSATATGNAGTEVEGGPEGDAETTDDDDDETPGNAPVETPNGGAAAGAQAEAGAEG